MSLDSLGHRAGREAREAASRSIDVEAHLVDLRRRYRRRTTALRAGAAAVLLAVVGAGALLIATAAPQDLGPIDRPSTVQTCAAPQCIGSGGFRVDLRAPFTWTVPEGYQQQVSGTTAAARPTDSDDRSPLLVLQDVRGGDYRSQATYPSTAAALAAWMQGSPDLHVTDVQPTALGGLQATSLVVAPTTGIMLMGTSGPLPTSDQLREQWFEERDAVSGYLQRTWNFVPTPGTATRIWLLDVPGGNVTAVVAPISPDPDMTEAQDALLTSLRFDAAKG